MQRSLHRATPQCRATGLLRPGVSHSQVRGARTFGQQGAHVWQHNKHPELQYTWATGRSRLATQPARVTVHLGNRPLTSGRVTVHLGNRALTSGNTTSILSYSALGQQVTQAHIWQPNQPELQYTWATGRSRLATPQPARVIVLLGNKTLMSGNITMNRSYSRLGQQLGPHAVSYTHLTLPTSSYV